MRSHFYHRRQIELDQGLALLRRQPEAIRKGSRVRQELRALFGIMGKSVQCRCELDQFGFDRGIMRGVPLLRRRANPAQRGVVVVPARVHRDHLRLAFAQGARGAGPAAQLDIAGFIKLGFVKTDQRLEISGGELFQNATVPPELGIGVAIRAWKM